MIPYRDDQGRYHFAPVTAVSIFLWVGAWLWLAQSSPSTVRAAELGYGLRPDAWRELAHSLTTGSGGDQLAELWHLLFPLVTYPFLHAGVIHCGTNALFFWVFGSRLEERAGSARFAVFLLLSAVLAGLAFVLVDASTRATGVGASGMVAATMAAHVLHHPKSRALCLVPVVVVPVVVQIPTFVLIGMWLALQLRPISRLLEIGPATPVSWTALVGGALAGLALAPLLLRRRARGRKTATR